VRWLVLSLFVVIGVSVVAGIAAAAFGGALTGLGSGFGGLYGVPALALTLLAVGVGIPAGVVVARRLRSNRRWLLAAAIVIGGVFAVAIGYERVAHTVDPCANGWWGPDSMIGSQPLCERFGSELNWHTRFHLAAHALPALVLLAGYAWAIQRWVAPPRHRAIDRSDGGKISTSA
jgi:hypothetical protein